jgi:hypothetical protein
MKYGWVSSNLVDLWTEPKFNSERASQLLFGQAVKVLKEKSGHYLLELTDGYHGWADRRFVALSTSVQIRRYVANINAFVWAPKATLSGTVGRKVVPPYHLFYGSRLFTRSTKEGYARVILPDKTRFAIKKSNLVPINTKSARQVTGRDLIREASRFLGVPYLWGGVTSAGFDCSGLVQTVCSRFGLYIPRDTKDQISAGEKVERDCIKTGDLLFFKRHVGFAIGKDRMIHSSVGGGGVRINSLVRGGADYREDLDRDFNQARRVTCSS